MKFITLILIVAVCEVALSKESDYTIGLFGSYNWYFHDVNFQQLPGYPNCCPKFESGTGWGYRTGILLEHKLSDLLYINSRMFYQEIESDISASEKTQLIQDNQLIDGEFEHNISTNMTFINMSVGLGIKLLKNLSIETGVYFSKNLSADFNQYEKISKPLNSATFADSNGFDTQKRIRNEFSGTLKNLNNLIYGLTGKISYNLPLSKKGNIRLTPELGYHINLNDLSDDLQWQSSSFELGLAFKYTPFIYKIENLTIDKIDTLSLTTKDVIEQKFVTGQTLYKRENEFTDDTELIKHIVQRTDTIFIPKPIEITANINVFGLDSNDVEIEKPKYIIEQFVSNRHQPLLHYIFFDSLSYKIPDRYIKLSKDNVKYFKINELSNKSTLETYYHALNIIGQRMLANPNAKIKLIGCNSGIGRETGNMNLSQNRANEVKNYLTSIWSIKPANIIIETKNLPQLYSYPINDFEKAQENRRMEIVSNTPELLNPVFISDTIMKASPSKVRFYIETTSDLPLKKWEFTLQNDHFVNAPQIKKYGNDTPPNSVDIEIKETDNIMERNKNFLVYYLNLIDVRGNNFTTVKKPLYIETITVDNKKRDKLVDVEINKFNLILFDFVSSHISESNSKIIELVKSKINSNSIVKIVGYTDRTGDADKNRALSLQRAQSAYQRINVSNSIVEGFGEDLLLQNNDLPEGRFYSRTVEIIVETPIENK